MKRNRSQAVGRTALITVFALACAAASTVARVAPAAADVAYGSYGWPVRGPVIRGFEPPAGPYGAGHRGIDIAAPFATPIHAPANGTVVFAGWVAGALYATIEHPGGVRTTYSWLSAVRVRRGDSIQRGQVFALTGHGHPGALITHLHFGARFDGEYIDPMLLLEPVSVADLIHLAPLEEPARAPAQPMYGPPIYVSSRGRGPPSL